MAVSKLPPERPRKFEVVYKDDDGCESIWKYDLDKFANGPISVEQKYTAEYLREFNKRMKEISAAKRGKLAELHDAFAKLDEKRKKAKAKKVEPTKKTQTTKKVEPKKVEKVVATKPKATTKKPTTKPTQKKVKLKEDKGFW